MTSATPQRHPTTCEEVQEVLAARLAGDETALLTEAMERHFADCPRCHAEQEEVERLWASMDQLAGDAPSAELRDRFARTLADYRATMDAEAPAVSAAQASGVQARPQARAPLPFRQRLRRRPLRFALRAGYGLAAALAGLAIGLVLARRAPEAETVTALHQEVRGLREVLALSLLQQGSASARLEGVSVGAGLATVDTEVRAALLDTLANDPNPNVRLAAVDALAPRAADPDVQRRLVEVLRGDGSPLVQIAVADALLASDGERARRLVAPLADDREVRPEVREFVRQRLGRST